MAAGDVTSVELVQAHLDRIAAVDGPETASGVHAFLHIDADGALATAAAVDADRAAGVDLPPLAGVPIAIKDVLVTKGLPTTAGSRILEGWVPPYDSTVASKIRAARMPILGKTNMDEFAMGSSTEHSGYGPTHNPWDLERIPGGSGGGSAARSGRVGSAARDRLRHGRLYPPARGRDRHRGGEAHVRRSVAATAPSPSRPRSTSSGPCARTVLDAAMLHEVMGGHDEMDATSLDEPVPACVDAAREGASGDLTRRARGRHHRTGRFAEAATATRLA